MPLSRSHMVGISKAFKLLGNYCDELRKLFSLFQLANFTVDIFLVATGILSPDQNNVSQLFYLFMLFLFFFVVVVA